MPLPSACAYLTMITACISTLKADKDVVKGCTVRHHKGADNLQVAKQRSVTHKEVMSMNIVDQHDIHKAGVAPNIKTARCCPADAGEHLPRACLYNKTSAAQQANQVMKCFAGRHKWAYPDSCMVHDVGPVLVHLLHLAAVLLKACHAPLPCHCNHQRLHASAARCWKQSACIACCSLL